MHELWQHTRDNTHAVTAGLTQTGRTITAAAAIMFAVFASFVLGDDRIIKLFGLGLASAVLIDALIVRTLLLPSVMLLLGRYNWALPRGLERVLPSVHVEPPEPATVRPAGGRSPASSDAGYSSSASKMRTAVMRCTG
jgi:RND superfamily putative drug exporter